MTTNCDGKTLILKIAQPGEILGLHLVISGKAHELSARTQRTNSRLKPWQPSQLAFTP